MLTGSRGHTSWQGWVGEISNQVSYDDVVLKWIPELVLYSTLLIDTGPQLFPLNPIQQEVTPWLRFST